MFLWYDAWVLMPMRPYRNAVANDAGRKRQVPADALYVLYKGTNPEVDLCPIFPQAASKNQGESLLRPVFQY
jgi:hypothetical protein